MRVVNSRFLGAAAGAGTTGSGSAAPSAEGGSVTALALRTWMRGRALSGWGALSESPSSGMALTLSLRCSSSVI